MKFIVFALLVLLSVVPAQARQTLVMNITIGDPFTNSGHTGALDLLYKELSKRTGIDFVLQYLPAERALINANSGLDDGDAARVSGKQITALYPNLIQVPGPLLKYNMAAFTRKADLTVAGPDSLKPYSVGIIRGWKILERGIVGTRSFVAVENDEQLFSLLDKDRVDVVVVDSTIGLRVVKTMGLKNIRLLQPPLYQGYWYPFLNKKHAALVPRIAAALIEMERDGTSQGILESVRQRYSE